MTEQGLARELESDHSLPLKKGKTTSRAERRALQEAQRAAKQEKAKSEGKLTVQPTSLSSSSLSTASVLSRANTASISPASLPSSVIQLDDQKGRKETKAGSNILRPRRFEKEVPLFSHLQQYERDRSTTTNVKGNIHPAVLQVSLKFANYVIVGANARCLAVLSALRRVIQDYKTPKDQIMNRHLDSHLKPMINYLVQFRPMAVSVGNSIRYLKLKIANLNPDIPESDAKAYLCDCIDQFINEKIVFADQYISELGASKISEGDVIMVYARSSIVESILVTAAHQKKRFRVIVVDNRPRFEGKRLLNRLVDEGIECSYIFIHAVYYMMSEVSKVILGAQCFFSNGFLMSRVGTSMVAITARQFNIPVLVACEAYKFTDRVHLDSFVFNELFDPDELATKYPFTDSNTTEKGSLQDWRNISSLKLPESRLRRDPVGLYNGRYNGIGPYSMYIYPSSAARPYFLQPINLYRNDFLLRSRKF